MCRKGEHVKGGLPDLEMMGEYAFEIPVWGGAPSGTLTADENIITSRTLGFHRYIEAMKKSPCAVLQGMSLLG